MCCSRNKAIEKRVVAEAENGWVTGYKVVRVVGDSHLRPRYASQACRFKEGENVIPAAEMKRSRYSRVRPHGFHIYLDIQSAFHVRYGRTWLRVIKVRGHVRSLIRAGTSGFVSPLDKHGEMPQAAFRRIRIDSLLAVPCPAKSKSEKAA
jgi:hypothetical protein